MADSVAATEAGEDRRRGVQHWIERSCGELARRDPTRLIHDVFYSPSIGPVAAWLIGGLIALVAWLTVHYAPARSRARTQLMARMAPASFRW